MWYEYLALLFFIFCCVVWIWAVFYFMREQDEAMNKTINKNENRHS